MPPADQAPTQAASGRPDRVGLLCADIKDANFLTAILTGARPDLPVDVMLSRPALDVWMTTITPAARLIAFCTDVVVPADALAVLGGRGYNFHPGPPAYPGKYPALFALYDGAKVFGATLHEMQARVDSGPIIGVTEFTVPPEADALWLGARAHQAALILFLRSVRDLVYRLEPLAALPISWSNRRCSRQAFEELSTVSPDIDPEELERRKQVIRQLPGAALRVVVQGQSFELKL